MLRAGHGVLAMHRCLVKRCGNLIAQPRPNYLAEPADGELCRSGQRFVATHIITPTLDI